MSSPIAHSDSRPCAFAFEDFGVVIGALDAVARLKDALAAATALHFPAHAAGEGAEAAWHCTDVYRQTQDAWAILRARERFADGERRA